MNQQILHYMFVTAILIVPISLIIFSSFRVHFEDLWKFTKYSLFQFYEKYDDASATSNLGPRPNVLYGNTTHYVTLTFYFTKDNDQHIENIYKSLLYYNIPKAVFFVEEDLMNEHPFLMYAIRNSGYTVNPWKDVTKYDQYYAPTVFSGISLTDREILSRVQNDADIHGFYFINTAIHNQNASIFAFTPNDSPRFTFHTDVFEKILRLQNNTIVFTDGNKTDGKTVLDSSYRKPGLDLTLDNYTAPILDTDFDRYTDSSKDIVILNGSWTMQRLHEEYPSAVDVIETPYGNAFLLTKTLAIGKEAFLNITGSTLYLKSFENDTLPIRLQVYGRVLIFNSTISSWNSLTEKPDGNPYHYRPYMKVDAGKLDIINSTISNFGFPTGGIDYTSYARAGIVYFDSNDFTIANSTLALNYYGFYSANSSNFRITNNEIYGSTRYGLDPHTYSRNFIVDSNYVHDNGNQGIICSKYCDKIKITNNIVENNVEGIGLHWSTNSSTVENNLSIHNQKYGIFIDKASHRNVISNNTIIGNNIGIGILDRSSNNTVSYNTITDNTNGSIHIDPDSQPNNVIGIR
jgi:parallel beta-helix repeat protein